MLRVSRTDQTPHLTEMWAGLYSTCCAHGNSRSLTLTQGGRGVKSKY